MTLILDTVLTAPFRLVTRGLDVSALVEQIGRHPELWGQQKARLAPDSPHAETQDIWVRFRDVDAYVTRYGRDMSHFVDEHESVWLPPAEVLPRAVTLAKSIAHGRPLGGVLITRTPPGGRIKPHIDSGWHAEQHRKFWLPLQNDAGCVFGWEARELLAEAGDLYEFRNDILHWVINGSERDRLSMIVCVRKEQ